MDFIKVYKGDFHLGSPGITESLLLDHLVMYFIATDLYAAKCGLLRSHAVGGGEIGRIS